MRNRTRHGDLHPDVLDYLEKLEKIKDREEMIRRESAKQLNTTLGPRADGEPPAARP